jgi:hypothetical protein
MTDAFLFYAIVCFGLLGQEGERGKRPFLQPKVRNRYLANWPVFSLVNA